MVMCGQSTSIRVFTVLCICIKLYGSTQHRSMCVKQTLLPEIKLLMHVTLLWLEEVVAVLIVLLLLVVVLAGLVLS